MFQAYVIRSLSTRKYYIGSAADLQQRLEYHNTNKTKWTRGKGPWELVWSEAYETRSGAVRKEREIKAWKSRSYMEKMLGLSDGNVG